MLKSYLYSVKYGLCFTIFCVTMRKYLKPQISEHLRAVASANSMNHIRFEV